MMNSSINVFSFGNFGFGDLIIPPKYIYGLFILSNSRYLGSRQDGSFAEYVAVPVQNVLELPENVSFEQAAMLEPMSVAIHAIRRIEVKQTDTVVVYGLGTIGLLLVMFLLEQGVQNIVAVGNKSAQKESVLYLGLPEANFCNCKERNVQD